MPNEMIERVAKVLNPFNSDACTCIECNIMRQNEKLAAIELAKAVIEAMKEPTEAMLDAGANYVEEGSSVIGCWENMIEAALKDG